MPRTIFGLPKIPLRYAGFVLPFLLSVFMTCIVSFVSTLNSIDFSQDFFYIWLGAWGLSWLIAFPTLLLVLPLVRRVTDAIVES